MTEQAAPDATPRSLDDSAKQAVRDALDGLRKNLPGFRERRSQAQMIAAVARAAATPKGVCVVEAPTGTGKSHGYSVGAIPIALKADRKVIIAAHTVALQQQLMAELPTFLAATGIEAKLAVAKGRQRYACLRDLMELAGGNSPQDVLDLGEEAEPLWPRPPKPEEVTQIQALATAYSKGQWTGDLDTVTPPLADDLRGMVTTTAGGCTNRRCAYFMECPFFAAKRAMENANIVIANHALVVADLRMSDEKGVGGQLLPAPGSSIYIIDEGHRLEEVAINAGAASVHLPSAARRLAKARRIIAAAWKATAKPAIAGRNLQDALGWLGEVGDGLKGIEADIRLRWTIDPTQADPVWRASLGQLHPEWRDLAAPLAFATGRLVEWGEKLHYHLTKSDAPAALRDKASRELGLILEQLEGQYELWSMWAAADSPDDAPTARWIDLGRDQGLTCHASSVSAAQFLRNTLWENADGVVLTSATLSAGGDFRNLVAGIGVPERAEILSLPSPFDLPNQARLEVPWLDAMPDDVQKHPLEISRWLTEHLDWNQGSLVLFTSKRKMNETARLLPQSVRSKVRLQGEVAKHALLAAHATDIAAGKGSVIFGLASFGEGVDLPGDLCTTVVLTQLPFAVPTDPIGATRCEWVEKRGGNPFFEITIPETIRTLTQYCGRLIRRESDHGRIVVLDRRLITKRYGQSMIDALPPFARRLEHRKPV